VDVSELRDLLINELFSNGKGRGPGPHLRGPTTSRIEGTGARRCAHRSTASGWSGAPKLTGGGAIERGEPGELC
jgi:hypothetical protein